MGRHRNQGFLTLWKRRRPRHPHPEAGQGGVREVALQCADRSEPLGYGLVERARRNLDGVRDAVHVLGCDPAGSDWHGRTIAPRSQ
jgi:hypothetical protein